VVGLVVKLTDPVGETERVGDPEKLGVSVGDTDCETLRVALMLRVGLRVKEPEVEKEAV